MTGRFLDVRRAVRCCLLFLVCAFVASASVACEEERPCVGTSCGPDASAADAGSPDACVSGSCGPTTCATLRTNGTCPPARVCETTASGPICQEACVRADEGFDPATGTCRSCLDFDCGPPATCTLDVAGSIADECLLAHRTCEGTTGAASCGGCVIGYRPNAVTGECVLDGVCGGRECTDQEMVVPLPSGDCECRQRPCETDEAERPDHTCEPCADRCIDATTGAPYEGATGAFHPTTAADGSCVCETKRGYFWPRGDHSEPQACDADRDHWISQSAWIALNAANGAGDPDEAIRSVADRGCVDRLLVDRIVLENEYGQTHAIHLCATGLVESDDGCPDGVATRPLTLVESVRNDDDAALERASGGVQPTAPVVGDRRFVARELNALTKACVLASADFDGNGTADVRDTQAPVDPIALDEDRYVELWRSFAYFTELHTSEYAYPMHVGAPGAMYIRERSRCADGDFPLGYMADPVDPEAPAPYWRGCARRPDAAFLPESPAPGFDFARFVGATPIPVPPLDASTPHGGDVPPHGLCDLPRSSWVADPWRGMTHHSQFKCVAVDLNVPPAVYGQPLASFDPVSGTLDFQRCSLRAPGTKNDATFECSNQTVDVGDATTIGWASVRYSAATAAERGCVDESMWRAEHPRLCAPLTPTTEEEVVPQHGDVGDFGRLVCDCRTYFPDVDRDGHGDPAMAVQACGQALDDTVPWVEIGDDCDVGDPGRRPGLADAVDVIGYDSNCDLVDGVLGTLVFVAPWGNDGTNGSTPATAVRTIRRGIDLAIASRLDVLVAGANLDGSTAPDYGQSSSLVLSAGVDVFGGYPATFRGARDRARTVLSGSANPLVYASGIGTSTTIDGLTIRGASVGGYDGRESIAVRIDSSNGLEFRNVEIRAGSGAEGSYGGVAGTSSCTRLRGGAGGTPSCSAGVGSGGSGEGEGSAGGGGGGGAGADNCGYGFANCVGGSIQAASGDDGGSGGNGKSGGGGGAGGDRDGSFSGADWIPSTGTAGGGGTRGGGGGGGGAGGSISQDGGWCAGNYLDVDGGGGGPGLDGGCGGNGGPGGGQGGASIAVLLYQSTVSFPACRVVGGAGGTGGQGGQGGWGDQPWLGIVGVPEQQTWNLWTFRGGNGGSGGRGGVGGTGGGGGGGNGGPSIGIVRLASSSVPVEPVYVAGTAGAGGPGGYGGNDGARGAGGLVYTIW